MQLLSLLVSGPAQGDALQTFTHLLSTAGARLIHTEVQGMDEAFQLSIVVIGCTLDTQVSAGGNGQRQTLSQVLDHEAAQRGLNLQTHTQPLSAPLSEPKQTQVVLTCVGPQIDLPLIAKLSDILQQEKIHITSLRPLSDTGVHEEQSSCIEINLWSSEDINTEKLGSRLRVEAGDGCDFILQPHHPFRRAKRLLVMDMDSTLIQVEVIDELAKACGIGEKIAAITHRTMNGELSFKGSLTERVALLKGLPADTLQEVYAKLPYTQGVKILFSVLRQLGCKTAVLSGGFDYFTSRVKDALQLDFHHSNRLEIQNGRLTGKVLGEIVDGEEKKRFMEEIALKEGIAREQIIAVGDGANDLPMIHAAGLGIAFNAKPRVRAEAPHNLTQPSLFNILYLLGYSALEIQALMPSQKA